MAANILIEISRRDMAVSRLIRNQRTIYHGSGSGDGFGDGFGFGN